MRDSEIRVHLVSYSFPPDNAPAAHRPYQLVRYMAARGIPFAAYTLQGGITELGQICMTPVAMQRNAAGGRGVGSRLLAITSRLLGRVLQVDKGLPWALRTLPGVIAGIRADRRAGIRSVLWATAPLSTNLWVAWMASVLTRSELHVDLRDAIDGINSRPMPWLTRNVLARAASVSVVTPSLADMVLRKTSIKPSLIYNGVAEESASARVAGTVGGNAWVEVAYAGAMYGGDRPYLAAIALLREAAELLPPEVAGVRLRIATREQLHDLLSNNARKRFVIEHCGELSKTKALTLVANSHANLLLVGSGEIHRCGIPLKTYDMLGVGRPILYFGPDDADAAKFLHDHSLQSHIAVNSEKVDGDTSAAIAEWLLKAMRTESRVIREPSAESQSAAIAALLGVGG